MILYKSKKEGQSLQIDLLFSQQGKVSLGPCSFSTTEEPLVAINESLRGHKFEEIAEHEIY